MYRDDIGMRKSLPLIRETSINFDIEKRVVILADDVMQAGRSVRAALDAITDFGRPAITRLAILIDRGKHEAQTESEDKQIDHRDGEEQHGEGRRVFPEYDEDAEYDDECDQREKHIDERENALFKRKDVLGNVYLLDKSRSVKHRHE